ncbi:MAG: capsular polysaccharide export protein, LipB/KpsS family [Aequorivita sp.]
MDKVYFYTRKYGWEKPIIDYFQKEKLWDQVFVSTRFIEEEEFYQPKYIEKYIPKDILDRLYAFLPQFIDMKSRTSALSEFDYEEYNYHDYLNLFSIYINVYYNFYTKNNINLLVMTRGPHLGFDLIAVCVAEVLNIKTLFLEQSHFPNRYFMYLNFKDFGEFSTSKIIAPSKPIKIEKKYEKELSYMDEEKLSLKQKYKKFYENNPSIRMLSQLTHKAFRGQAIYRYDLKHKFKKNREKYNQPIDLKEKFIYFGLHLQPEQTTSAWGGEYVDQLLALERLSEFIPDDVKIYVKENPKQTYVMRGELFYKRLQRIKKLVLVPNETNTYALIKNCLFVSTISGTMGWEAITGGKNVLIFGWGVWYKTFPGVFSFEDNPDYKELLTNQIDHSQLEKEATQLKSKTGKGIVFPISYYFDLVPGFTPEQNTKDIAASIKKFLYTE